VAHGSRCEQRRLISPTVSFLVDADHVEFVLARVRKRRFAAIGHDDRRAVRSMQCKELYAWRHEGRLREQRLHLFRLDFPQVGDFAAAEDGEGFGSENGFAIVGHLRTPSYFALPFEISTRRTWFARSGCSRSTESN